MYAFVGATLGPRTGVVAGWGLAGTYMFYAVTTAAAAGIFGTGLLDSLGIWKNQPSWAPFACSSGSRSRSRCCSPRCPRAGAPTCC